MYLGGGSSPPSGTSSNRRKVAFTRCICNFFCFIENTQKSCVTSISFKDSNFSSKIVAKICIVFCSFQKRKEKKLCISLKETAYTTSYIMMREVNNRASLQSAPKNLKLINSLQVIFRD
jgi:hypothetical protein